MAFSPDSDGFYGPFGGAFVPEMLYANVAELQQNYLRIIDSELFKASFADLLKHFAGRPTPLFQAKRLSEKYGYHIYLKREDLCHTGAHKINNAIGQALLAKNLGKKRIVAETGAGQHGVATAAAHDMERQKPNVFRMKMLGATIRAAKSGSQTLKDATNEAMRYWIANATDTHYIIGSAVGPHPYPDMVARFQSVISEETMWQLPEMTAASNPDYVIACVGGGSNAIGAFYHYLNNPKVNLIGVEAAGMGEKTNQTAATLGVGSPGVLHGANTYVIQTADGQIIEPYSISAGLDYPGIGPIHPYLQQTGRAVFMSVTDAEALVAARELSELEGIIPALESAHALAVLGKLNLKPENLVIVNLSGRGDKDLETYMKHLPE
jgi:tryptophan synthase beta chain